MDIAGATGDALVFHRDDPLLGRHEVSIPLAELKRTGHFVWRSGPIPGQRNPYMERMGVDIEFFLEAELVRLGAPLDQDMVYELREAIEPGDFFYLRVEQMDTVTAWSSPVWAN